MQSSLKGTRTRALHRSQLRHERGLRQVARNELDIRLIRQGRLEWRAELTAARLDAQAARARDDTGTDLVFTAVTHRYLEILGSFNIGALVLMITGALGGLLLLALMPQDARYVWHILPGTLPSVMTRVKVAQTCNLTAVVRANGKNYSVSRETKVTLGGCGG